MKIYTYLQYDWLRKFTHLSAIWLVLYSMKKYINERSCNAFCSQLQFLNPSHIKVKMSQDQNELDRAIDSIVQAGMEDQPFDLETFFAPLPDTIIQLWEAEDARQAQLDAEEHQRWPTHTTIWPGRNLHTPVLMIPSESISMPYENIIAPLDDGFTNFMPQVELPSEESSTIIPPEEPIAAVQENIRAIAISPKDVATVPNTIIPPRKTRAECLAQRRPKRKTRAECLEEVRIKRGRRAGGDVSQFQDADNGWLCEAAAKASEAMNSEDDDWLVAAAVECEPAILPPVPVIAGLVADTEHGADAVVAGQRMRLEAEAEAVVVANHIDEVIEAVVGRRIEQRGGALDRTAPNVSYCDICNRRIRYCERDRHMQDFHGLHVCNRCGARSNSRAEFAEHKRICPQRPFAHYLPDSNYFFVFINEALDGSILNYACHPKRVSTDLAVCMTEFSNYATKILARFVIDGNLKFNTFVKVTFYKALSPDVTIQAHFNKGRKNGLHMIRNLQDVATNLEFEIQALTDWVEYYANRASNWLVQSIDLVELTVHKPEELAGGCERKVSIPKNVSARSILNLLYAPSNQCFKFVVLAALHYKEIENRERRYSANTYMTYENECDFSGLAFPVKAYDIAIFEHQNPQIAVYAHQHVNNKSKCLYKSIQPEAEKNIHLFLHDNHWMPITHLSGFYREGRASKYYICERCIKSFCSPKLYRAHVDEPCRGDRAVQRETIPENAELKFTDFEKCTSVPYVMYADIEAVLSELEPVEGANTIKTHAHLPAAIGNMMIMIHDGKEYHEKYVEHVGPDCIVQFIDYIEEMCCKIDSWERQFYTRCEADRTEYDKIVFAGATTCYICEAFFTAC